MLRVPNLFEKTRLKLGRSISPATPTWVETNLVKQWNPGESDEVTKPGGYIDEPIASMAVACRLSAISLASEL